MTKTDDEATTPVAQKGNAAGVVVRAVNARGRAKFQKRNSAGIMVPTENAGGGADLAIATAHNTILAIWDHPVLQFGPEPKCNQGDTCFQAIAIVHPATPNLKKAYSICFLHKATYANIGSRISGSAHRGSTSWPGAITRPSSQPEAPAFHQPITNCFMVTHPAPFHLDAWHSISYACHLVLNLWTHMFGPYVLICHHPTPTISAYQRKAFHGHYINEGEGSTDEGEVPARPFGE
ncbi:hypothetical protein JB92DRAFT_2832205 [Gautieria morchelliformis]|nr:hypothetical protein JB92DRAFT_2832205 [Gautieria morchelliformis]